MCVSTSLEGLASIRPLTGNQLIKLLGIDIQRVSIQYPSPSGESINKIAVEKQIEFKNYDRYPSPNGESINKTLASRALDL